MHHFGVHEQTTHRVYHVLQMFKGLREKDVLYKEGKRECRVPVGW